MNFETAEAAKVWDHTLTSLRHEKRRRKLRLSLLTSLPVLLLFPLTIAMLRPGETPIPEPHTVTRNPEPSPSLAVMVLRNGIPTLETLSTGDLGSIELRFSLDPIVADCDALTEKGF